MLVGWRMAQWLRAYVEQTNRVFKPGFHLSAHVGQLTTACNSRSKGSIILFWTLHSLMYMYKPIYRHTSVHINKNKLF